MLKMSVLPADKFLVFNKTILNEMDKKIIVMLYQPIIGIEAVNLYLTLSCYLDKTENISDCKSHHNLMTSMQTNLEEIIIAREKLEAVGLLKTYVKKGDINEFVYELYSPLTPQEFINNPILSVCLSSNIGSIEYEKIISYFKIVNLNLKDYQDISCLFNEVFSSIDYNNFSNTNDIRTIKKNKLLLNIDFNLDEVISEIPDEFLSKKTVVTDIKDLIYKLIFIYNLNDEQTKAIIFDSINERHLIDKELLKQNARKLYRFENEGRLPTMIYRSQPEYLRQKINDDSNRARIIYKFETTTPYDFLVSKNNGSRPTKADLKLIEYLLIDLSLEPGVVNVLIDYVLKINNNKLTKSFVEAIASQWIKSSIKTVSDAMKIAEEEYHKRTKRKTRQTKTKEKPNWFDKNLEENKATDEEIANMEKMLSEFR